MASLSLALKYYIHLKLDYDPGWQGIKVILSDANVPGEGEHKVASYIRSQRNLPGFNLDTRHCLYGLDADLIMLALATHEIHFCILREDVRTDHKNGNIIKFGKHAKGKGNENRKSNIEICNDITAKRFQFLNIWVLREYLSHDLRIPDAKMKIDLERLIDDFVFICLFVGNDFLPHIPSLEISEGAIDLLMTNYCKEFNTMGGYLTESFKVDLERVEHFLQVIGSYETAIFKKRSQVQRERELCFQAILNSGRRKKTLDPQSSSKHSISNLSNGGAGGLSTIDRVKLGEEGWKERYYVEKLQAETKDGYVNITRQMVKNYTEGICWVMHYYYEGVCAWQWFYPYHYAPFASDFTDLKHVKIRFKLGVPFKPFEQLMGVLPSASAHALPLLYRNLMTDASSSIADFYPPDFELDLNGKRFSWQAVCKLPFIEESRLLAEIQKVEHTLTDEEKHRNSWAMDLLFVHTSHPLSPKILSFIRRKRDHPKFAKCKVKKRLDPKFSGGMNGFMYISDKTIYSEEIYSPIEDLKTISNNQTLFVYFKGPDPETHIPRPPDGVVFPSKSISKQDVQQKRKLWHETTISRGSLSSKRPVPNSISGTHLSKISHHLVSKFLLGGKQPIHGGERHERSQNQEILGKGKRKGGKSCHGRSQKRRNLGEKETKGMKESAVVAEVLRREAAKSCYFSPDHACL
ncbi:5'-3' exoribonuclease 3 [Apostasia shenzhenica]|uniref:5'-3' exoribonuclease n=1 Tax=Apostasia shenzhenica TaxID=1088818 RepID=A0A2I0ALA0_9ASPA|nr:5'-3' exoribonuclease 3 [Apostasia shenzhenica]